MLLPNLSIFHKFPSFKSPLDEFQIAQMASIDKALLQEKQVQ